MSILQPILFSPSGETTSTPLAPPSFGAVTAYPQNSSWMDGEGGYYQTAYNSNWDLPNSDWFIAVLIKMDVGSGSFDAAHYFLNNGTSGNGRIEFYADANRPFAIIPISGGGFNFLNPSTGGLNDGKWRILVLQRDGSNYVIKGCPLGETTVTTYFTLAHTTNVVSVFNNVPLRIGAKSNDVGFYKNHFARLVKGSGAISDVDLVSLAGGQVDFADIAGLTPVIDFELNGDATITDRENSYTATKQSTAGNGKIYPRGCYPFSGQAITITTNNGSKEFGRVYQREFGTTSKTITFSGNYKGSPSAIEARIVQAQGIEVLPWKNCTVPSAGDWTVNFNVPQGGNYILEVRHKNDPLTVAKTQWHFGVGMIVIFAGQSNSLGMFNEPMGSAYAVDAELFLRSGAYEFNRGSGARFLNFYNEATKIPGCWALMDRLSENIGAPVFCAQLGTGGTTLVGGWDNPSSASYQNFLAGLAEIGGDAEWLVWIQGEQDTIAAGMTAETYAASFGTLRSRMQTDIGRTQDEFDFVIHTTGRRIGAGFDDRWGEVREGQLLIAETYDNVYYGGGTHDIVMKSDGLHWTGDGAYRIGHRTAQTIGNQMLPATYPNDAVGPALISATASGNDVICTFALNGNTSLQGRTGPTGLEGFRIKDASNNVIPITGTAISGNTVILSTGSTPAAGWSVSHMRRANITDNETTLVATNPLYGDKPILGLSGTVDVPANPSKGEIILS